MGPENVLLVMIRLLFSTRLVRVRFTQKFKLIRIKVIHFLGKGHAQHNQGDLYIWQKKYKNENQLPLA